MQAAAATSRQGKSPKRKKIDVESPPSAKRRKHASSSHVSSTDTSSSPITVATTRKTASSKSKIEVLLPPVWSSDEEDELSKSNENTEDDDLDEEQLDSSQLTKKEKKAIALKRLKKARKNKGEKAPYYSPILKSKLNGRSNKKANSRPTQYESDEFDELATQIPGSMSDAVAPMPWEPDEEDITLVNEKEEPVYNEKLPATVIDDLPPPLPQPEKVWKRKVRPLSRTDLFDATQRPSTRRASPVPPIRKRENSDELPDLIPRTSSNTKHESSTPAKGAVYCKTEPSSATLNEAQSSRRLTRSISVELSPALQRSASAKIQQTVEEEEEIAALPTAILIPKEETTKMDPLPPANVLEELPYWEDNSFMEGDFSIGDEDVNMANLRPFFTPSPPREMAAPVAGPSTIEYDKLIAKAAEPTQFSMTQHRRSASPIAAITSTKHTPIARQTSPALGSKISSSAKRASQAVVDVKGSPSVHGSADRPLTRADKGKGRAIYEEPGRFVTNDDPPRSSLKEMQEVSEEEWSDVDELELTQGSMKPMKQTGLNNVHASPLANSSTSVSNKIATSAQKGARGTSPVEAGEAMKLPSSEEESQACSFCGNIYPISSLPTHVEACQAAQISAAASHAGKAGSTVTGAFKYSEEPKQKPKPGPLNSIMASTSKAKAGFESEPHKMKTQGDDLEALLFGKPSVKARQIHTSPQRLDKGKIKATDDTDDDLTSPDVPLRQMRAPPKTNITRARLSSKREDVEDVIELDDDENSAKPNGHSWRSEPATKTRRRPLRAPDPQPGPAVEVDYDDQDIGSSPPAGSIFISQLPKAVQQGYFRLCGLDTHGEIATTSMNQLIQKPKALPTRGPTFFRGRGRGAPSRRGKGRSKKK